MSGFAGFPAVGHATAVPNAFFSAILPRLRAPGDLLAFLWALRLLQERRGEARFVTVAEVWAQDGAAATFAAMGASRDALDHGLRRCAELGGLLAVELSGPGGAEVVYFLNDPGSRRAIARARAGGVQLRPGAVARPVEIEARPGIFTLYEQNIGTITPMVAERLIAAEETYPWEWIVDAFREATELNRRNWRYIERILRTWEEDGRHEASGRDPVAAQRERYLGGALGHIVRDR